MPKPGEITSEVPLRSTGIPTLQPNSYVILRISGTLEAERNPYLGSSAVQGQIVRSYTPVQSTESTGRGATNVWLRPTGSNPPPSGGTRVSYFFRPAANGNDLVLMVRTGNQPIEVWAERERMPGAALFYSYCRAGKPYCTPDGPDWIKPDTSYIPLVRTWVEDYWVVSSHVVTATAVPEPLIVEGPTSVTSGQTASFTARAWEDLRLRYPQGQPGDVRWMWYPTDTIDGKPASHLAQAVCATSQLSCQFEPKVSGRLRVTSYVEGAQVETERIVRVRKERFELKCNGAQDSVRITRADELTCQASGATDITGWEFRADSSGYRNPAAGGTPFKGIEWKGRVVLSGTVTVTAHVAGAPESKSVRVRVEAREWGGMTMPRSISEENPALHLPLRPDSLRQLGDIHQGMDLGFPGMDKWAAILSGPNANLAYLVKPPAEYRATVHVNRAALSRDSDFWKAQFTRQRSSGIVDCLQREADITDFIPVVLRHEGIGFDPKSHAYLYVTTADRVGNPRYERVIGSSLQELADQSAAVLAMARDSAVAASALADSPGYAPTWCRFHFNYRSR